MSPLSQKALFVLCFVAGKSGGHLVPCLTQAENVLQKTDSKAYLFSSGSALDYHIMGQHPKVTHIVPSQLDAIPYRQPWELPWFFCQLLIYFFSSLWQLWQLNPACIISYGGLNSVPVCIAGWLLGIDFQVHELNVKPGQATKFLSYFTDRVYIYFTQTAAYFPKKECIISDYPVRFSSKDLIFDREKICTAWNLQPDRKTVLILGGSQGSIFINQFIAQVVQNNFFAYDNLQIIHQVGQADSDDYKKLYERLNIPAVVFGYNGQLQDFYNLADLVVCRAGAGTLFELVFFKKPAIIIPLETDLNNHQVDNATAMATMYPEQFEVVKQSECSDNLAVCMIKMLKLMNVQ